MPASGQAWDPDFAQRSEWFGIYAPVLTALAGRATWPGAEDYSRLVEGERLARAPELRPLAFAAVPPKTRRSSVKTRVLSELYDGRIAEKSEVPCLDQSYHDLFNALVFAAFPRSKRALHARQYAALQGWFQSGTDRLPSRRTREQDALTIFDEGGSVVLLSSNALSRYRAAGFCLELTETHRNDALPVLFGHAILEHLHASALRGGPAPDLRASALVLELPQLIEGEDVLELVDRWLCRRLEDPAEFTSPRTDAVLTLEPSGRIWLGRPAPPLGGLETDQK